MKWVKLFPVKDLHYCQKRTTKGLYMKSKTFGRCLTFTEFGATIKKKNAVNFRIIGECLTQNLIFLFSYVKRINVIV